MNFAKELWIQANTKLHINDEEYSVRDIFETYIWFKNQWTTKEYCIGNIAQLLMLQPTFENQAIQKKLEMIKAKDEKLMQKREALHDVLWNELIWEWKTYLLHNGCIWHSGGIFQSEESETIKPAATLITKDILGFKPINKKFSIVGKNAYFLFFRIWKSIFKPNAATLKPLGDSNYCHDWSNVFHCVNHVQWASIQDQEYEIISNDRIELLKDSLNNWFSWHEKLDIKHPETLKHIVDNFLSDWENIYMISWNLYNFTELFKLDSGQELSKIDENTYKIGEKKFIYDESKGIERLDVSDETNHL